MGSDVTKIKGLTINLKGVSDGETVTLTVEKDYDSLSDAMQEVVYNMEPVKKMGIQQSKRLSLENQQMIDLVSHLKSMKEALTPEFISQMKALDTEEKFKKEMAKLRKLIKKKKRGH